jgi:hypothetical protein
VLSTSSVRQSRQDFVLDQEMLSEAGRQAQV